VDECLGRLSFLTTAISLFYRELRLEQNFFMGALPSETMKMTSLEVLSLSANIELGPDLPSELASLPNLLELDVSFCSFVALPDSLVNDGTIEVLNISGNAITNEGLPTTWTSTALTTLDLSGLIDVMIPFPAAELAELVNLKHLFMRNGALTGSIPSEVGSFAALETLDLERNLLAESLPPELGDVTTLRR